MPLSFVSRVPRSLPFLSGRKKPSSSSVSAQRRKKQDIFFSIITNTREEESLVRSPRDLCFFFSSNNFCENQSKTNNIGATYFALEILRSVPNDGVGYIYIARKYTDLKL